MLTRGNSTYLGEVCEDQQKEKVALSEEKYDYY